MYLLLLKQILNIVNREDDLNGNNIVGKIGKQIEKNAHLLIKNGKRGVLI